MNRDPLCKIVMGVVVAVTVLSGSLEAGGVSKKPQLPIQVSVQPARTGVTMDSIRPGERVDLIVSATALREVDEVHISVRTDSGASIVTGSRQLIAAAVKGSAVNHYITIEMPKQGIGRIAADVSFLINGKVVVARKVQYDLGSDSGNGKKMPQTRKTRDGKGRNIIEYE